MNAPVRNLVVAIGAFASGKTKFLVELIGELERRGIPVHDNILSDAAFIIQEILRDDEVNGGVNHEHPWCKEKRGHRHVIEGQDITPFTALSNGITDPTIKAVFRQMLEAPSDKIVPVELGIGGRNTNPASEIDLSCGRIAGLLERGDLPIAALDRVLFVAHPRTSWEGRLERNKQRRGLTYADKEVSENKASWYIEPEGLQITGQEDDFMHLYPFLIGRGVRWTRMFSNEPNRDELSPEVRQAAETIDWWWHFNMGEGRIKGERG